MRLPQELRDQGTVIDPTWRDAGRRAGGAGQEEIHNEVILKDPGISTRKH